MIPARLRRLHLRWRRTLRLAGLLHAATVGLPLLALAAATPGWPLTRRSALALLAAALMLGVGRSMLARAGSFRIEAIARHLDRILPELEESSDLLLLAPDRLPPLGRLQRERILARLGAMEEPALPRRPLAIAAGGLLLAAAIAAGILAAAPMLRAAGPGPDADAGAAGEGASIRGMSIGISPPAYTGLPVRHDTGLALSAPQGSRLALQVETEGPVDAAILMIDGEAVPLTADGAGSYRGEILLDATRLAWLRLERDGVEVARSDHARLVAIPDRPPGLRVVRPAPFQKIEPQLVGSIDLEVDADDDYGLTDAAIVATLALGSGEQVEFRERRMAFPAAVTGRRQKLAESLDLASLGLVPGSELYVHVEVADNRVPEPNRARTPSMRIVVAGGLGPSIDLGSRLPILDPPEFLRSQRQIILDTEKLVAERMGIPPDRFEYRSQLIGDDQSALRLRYGGLLGEESEDGSPLAEHEDHDDPEAPAGHGEGGGEVSATIAALPEGFVHQHDSEESATFFPDPVRRTFREMLGRMWEAEGLLRTNRPAEALPHEYAALKLLKSIQEGSRIYVQKVGFDAPPLRPEEDRLSGDLSEIADVRASQQGNGALPAAQIRRVLRRVRSLRRGEEVAGPSPAEELDAVQEALERQARLEPAFDLRALDALTRLRAGPATGLDEDAIRALETALWDLLPDPEERPGGETPDDGSLYRAYRRHLESSGDEASR